MDLYFEKLPTSQDIVDAYLKQEIFQMTNLQCSHYRLFLHLIFHRVHNLKMPWIFL